MKKGEFIAYLNQNQFLNLRIEPDNLMG